MGGKAFASVSAAADVPNLVSVDDHIVEPPTLWQDRLPRKYLEAGPRVVRERVGYNGVPDPPEEEARASDVWYFEQVRVPTLRIYASVGFDLRESDAIGMTYDEMRRGCYEPNACLADMDVNGVDASLGFPNLFLRFCGQRLLEATDKELALLCVRAYNDFLFEEWERVGGGRLIGATLTPLWDVALAVAEVRRNAARGARAVCFSEIPAWLGLPSLHSGYWDPFFAACAETGTLVAMHIGSSSTAQTTSEDAPPCLSVTNLYTNSSLSLSDFLLSGLFARFPDLKIAYAESQAGWIPYILQRLDTMWKDDHKFMRTSGLVDAPSSYYRNHVYSCIFNDRIAVEHLLEPIGVDNLCFETDYPHADGTWPNSKAAASQQLEGLSQSTVEKIVRGNAIRMLRLEDREFARQGTPPAAQ
jgi:predicted TIM-barrel fold metal-dependent hydrolase